MNTNLAILRPQAAMPLPQINAEDIEKALTIGDLAKMPPDVRIRYYLATCESAGLNPMTQPFTPLKNQAGQVILYANATAAEQLRKRDRISVRILSRETDEGLYTVTVAASTPDGRCEEAQGIVDVTNLKGVALANARMKCETKAKRRVTLAICGLGYQLEEPAYAQAVPFNPQTGELPMDDPLMIDGSLDEPQKGLQDHIADLYGDRAPAVSPIAITRASAIGQEIEQLCVMLSYDDAKRDAYWVHLGERYPDLTPGVLSLVRDYLQGKVQEQAAVEALTDTEAPTGTLADENIPF